MNDRLRVSRVVAALVATICAAGMLAGTAPATATGMASTGRGLVLSKGQHSARSRSVVAWLSRHTDAAGDGPAETVGRARRGRAAPTVQVGTNPYAVLVVPSTHTVYVGNIGGNTLSVINAATCNARVSTGCRDTPHSITVGYGPLGEVFDPATHTLYVANLGSNTVSVINAATCNAEVSTGCDQVPKTVAVGSGPTVIALDRATHTVYVANGNVNTLSVIDAATCNARVSTSCAATPPTVTVGSGPSGMAIDQATDTVYTANFNDASASVVNGATCNATDLAGCGQHTTSIPLPGPGDGVVIDQASHTAYISYATASLGGAAMIDTATCNATITTGCAHKPVIVPGGSGPTWIAENPATRTVYIPNEEDSNVTVLDAATCNIHDRSGCVTPLPAIASAYNAGGIDIDVATDTIYYASQSDNSLTVLNGATCNAVHTRGCTKYAPTTTVGTNPAGIAADPATDTVYVANQIDNDLSVINAAVCRVHMSRGCGRSWPTVATGVEPQSVAIDQATDTIYVANADLYNGDNGTTVSVIDGATCNAHVTSGCDQTPKTVTVGKGAYALAVDQRTNTIYVANSNDGTVSVIDGNTCDSVTTSGCGRRPATIRVGRGPNGVAIDDRTRTVYVSNGGTLFESNGGDNTVSVINAATCNATEHAGCGQQPPEIAVGNGPYGLDVDHDNSTVYVANYNDGTVSLINDKACNARTTSGCDQHPTAIPTGQLPFGVTVDDETDTVYVDSFGNSDIDLYHGDTCNTTTTTSCARPPAKIATGGYPNPVAVAGHTVYTADNGDGQVSYFSTSRR